MIKSELTNMSVKYYKQRPSLLFVIYAGKEDSIVRTFGQIGNVKFWYVTAVKFRPCIDSFM